jgi:hypothetical protein
MPAQTVEGKTLPAANHKKGKRCPSNYPTEQHISTPETPAISETGPLHVWWHTQYIRKGTPTVPAASQYKNGSGKVTNGDYSGPGQSNLVIYCVYSAR